LCGENCSRDTCEIPCSLMLACGHNCVGLCNEPCPPLCRICNKDELTEIFFGNEDEEKARWAIDLKKCKTVFTDI
jgi:hypothetical protein